MKTPLYLSLVTCLTLLAGCDQQSGQPATSAAAAADTPAEATPAAQPPLPPADPVQQAIEPALGTDSGSELALQGLDNYAQQATALSQAIADQAEIGLLKTGAEALLDLAAGISPAYVARHPHCEEYLTAALQVRDIWSSLDYGSIERDYHHDGALPKPENVGVCYHMKDLIVHPATMLVLLSQPKPDYAQSKREIDEVIAHLAVLRTQL